MADVFASGRIIDLIIVFVFLEAVALAVYHKATGRGLTLADIAAALAPGLALMLALRAALIGAVWHEIALWLGVSLIAHLFDVWRRS